MQEPARHRLAKAELAVFSELNHAANCLTAVFRIEASVIRETGERSVEHFLDRVVDTAGLLLADVLLLLRFEFDGHTFNVASSAESCNRAFDITARRTLLIRVE